MTSRILTALLAGILLLGCERKQPVIEVEFTDQNVLGMTLAGVTFVDHRDPTRDVYYEDWACDQVVNIKKVFCKQTNTWYEELAISLAHEDYIRELNFREETAGSIKQYVALNSLEADEMRREFQEVLDLSGDDYNKHRHQHGFSSDNRMMTADNYADMIQWAVIVVAIGTFISGFSRGKLLSIGGWTALAVGLIGLLIGFVFNYQAHYIPIPNTAGALVHLEPEQEDAVALATLIIFLFFAAPSITLGISYALRWASGKVWALGKRKQHSPV